MKNQRFNLIRGFYNREIEKDFQLDYFEKLKHQIRVGFALSISIYLIFYFIDSWVFAELEPQLMKNRIIVCSIFSIILASSFHHLFARYLQIMLLFFGSVAITGILFKIWLLNSSGYDFSFFYTGLILTISIVTFYLRIQFIYSVLLNLFCIISYVYLYLNFLEETPVHTSVTLAQSFVNSMLFVTSGSLLSSYGAYYLEAITRKDYIAKKQLWVLNNNLDQLVNQRTSELEKEKQKNISMLLKGQENERERIATELHDSISNQLTLIKHDLEYQNEKADFSSMRKTIEAVSDISQEVRFMSQNQSAHLLKKHGLPEAIQELANTLSVKYQIKISLHFHGTVQNINGEIGISLYRTCQEAMHNAIKHAQPSEIEVQLIRNHQSIELSITDNGKGFNPGQYKGTGSGLDNIKLRVEEQLGGLLSINSMPDRGTTIAISLNNLQYD